MGPRPSRATRNDALLPYTTLCRSVPFHLPLLARRAGAPNGKVARMALAFHRINACIARIVSRPGQRAIIGNGSAVEIEAAVELIAMLGCNAFGIIDHLADMVRGDRDRKSTRLNSSH